MDGSFVWVYFCVPPMYGDYGGQKRTLDPWAWVCIHFSYVLCNHLICLADHRPSRSPTLLNFSALIWDVIHHSEPQFIFLYVKIHWEQYMALLVMVQPVASRPHIFHTSASKCGFDPDWVWHPRSTLWNKWTTAHCLLTTPELWHVFVCAHHTHRYTDTMCLCTTQSKLTD